MKLKKVIVLLVLTVTPIIADISDAFRPKALRLSKFRGRCNDHKDVPIYLQNIRLQNINRVLHISFDAYIKRNINNELKFQLELTRCKSQDLDSCEKYQDITVNNLCKFLNTKIAPWAPLVQMFEPSIECPLKKGFYKVRNGTLDASSISHLPFSGYYWKSRPIVYDQVTNDMLLCLQIDAQLVPT